MLKLWYNIINSGAEENQAFSFSDKLRTRNKLSLLCSLFSLPYVVFFAKSALIIPLIAISIGIILFATSIILNKYNKFTLSSVLVLLTTNYCVLFFSIYLGMSSGIHLYLFTSPLIVFTLFDTKNKHFISMALLSYLMTFVIIVLFEKYSGITFLKLQKNELYVLYFINFTFSIIILISLSLYFFINNTKINQLLVLKNDELVLKQQQLESENQIRKNAEVKANDSLKEREILLSEIHHRVKNNMAVVNGLLELQASYISDEITLQVLKESQNRVKSIALLHEKLYENKTLKEVKIKDYTNELSHFIKQSYAPKKKEIKFISHIDSINLEMNKAMPFALLLNELMSNSYKYAFENKENGTIEIHFTKQLNNYIFEYRDDGLGFDYETERKKASLGLNLIESFSEQLYGTFEYIKKEKGMQFLLKF